jgi:hypothetical protein
MQNRRVPALPALEETDEAAIVPVGDGVDGGAECVRSALLPGEPAEAGELELLVARHRALQSVRRVISLATRFAVRSRNAS